MSDDILKEFLSGTPFRNGFYSDKGVRYRVKANDLGQKYIVMIGDWLDINNRTSTLHFKEATDDYIHIENVYSGEINFLKINDLIFFREKR